MRAFLTAVHQRDVDKALKIAGVDRPTDNEARFLDPEALSSDLKIVSVETIETDNARGDDGVSDTAQVAVTLSGPEGNEKGSFHLEKSAGIWRIPGVLLAVDLPVALPFWYWDANGKKISYTARSTLLRHMLLPGYYRFYASDSRLVTTKFRTALLLSSQDHSMVSTAPFLVEYTAAGQEAVAQAFRTAIGECAKQADGSPPNCPFGAPFPVNTSRGAVRFWNRDVRWKVLRYPTMKVLLHPAMETGTSSTSTVSVIDSGIVRLSGTGRNTSGQRVSFSIQCRIGERGRPIGSVGVTAEDTVRIILGGTGTGWTCP